MATSTTLIKRAIRLLQEGTDPSDDELDQGLEGLNAMMGTWANDGLMCYAIRDESFNITNGTRSYTIGPSGDLNTTRPVSIEGAYVIVSGVSYPVTVLETPQQYAGLPTKTQTADWPNAVYYEPDMPAGTLFCYLVPNQTVELHLLTKTPIGTLALGDTISLPPGWEDAIAYNLAIALSSEYENDPKQSVVLMARNTKRAIRKTNTIPIVAAPALSWLKARRVVNILTDGT